MVMVSDYYTQDVIDMMKDSMKDFKKSMKQNCNKLYEDKNLIKECEDAADAFQGMHLSDGSNIGSVLGDVSKKSEFLYYMGFTTKPTTVDFNSLKCKMAVFYLDLNNFFPLQNLNKDNALDYFSKVNHKLIKKMTKSRFDGSQESALRIGKALVSKKNRLQQKYDYDDDEVSTLRGDIGDKVSYLTIALQTVTFSNAPCNCDSLFLCESELSSSSEGIRVNNLIVDENTHKKLINLENGKIEVNQYTLYLVNINVNYNYQVSYRKDGWGVKYSNYGTDFDGYSLKQTVPYGVAKSFAIIAFTYYVDINVHDTSLDVYTQINVTVLDKELSTSAPITPGGSTKVLDSNNILKIVTTGEWKEVDESKKPNVILTCDTSKFEVEEDENNAFKVSIEEPYSYKPKKSGPNIAMIVGIVVAVVVVIAIVVVVVIVVIRKKRNAANNSVSEGNAEDKA